MRSLISTWLGTAGAQISPLQSTSCVCVCVFVFGCVRVWLVSSHVSLTCSCGAGRLTAPCSASSLAHMTRTSSKIPKTMANYMVNYMVSLSLSLSGTLKLHGSFYFHHSSIFYVAQLRPSFGAHSESSAIWCGMEFVMASAEAFPLQIEEQTSQTMGQGPLPIGIHV